MKRQHPAVGGELARFAGVGALGTIVHFVVLVILVEFGKVPSPLATSAGFIFGAAVNYLGAAYWVFPAKRDHLRSGYRFFLVAVVSMGLNLFICGVGVEVLGLHYLLAQTCATGTVFLLNFGCNKLWSFQSARPNC